jgi:hypothetical protein
MARGVAGAGDARTAEERAPFRRFVDPALFYFAGVDWYGRKGRAGREGGALWESGQGKTPTMELCGHLRKLSGERTGRRGGSGC